MKGRKSEIKGQGQGGEHIAPATTEWVLTAEPLPAHVVPNASHRFIQSFKNPDPLEEGSSKALLLLSEIKTLRTPLSGLPLNGHDRSKGKLPWKRTPGAVPHFRPRGAGLPAVPPASAAGGANALAGRRWAAHFQGGRDQDGGRCAHE